MNAKTRTAAALAVFLGLACSAALFADTPGSAVPATAPSPLLPSARMRRHHPYPRVTSNSRPTKKESGCRSGKGDSLSLAILIDDSLESDVANQWNEFQRIHYGAAAKYRDCGRVCVNSQANIAQDFTTDHALAAKALRIPLGRFGIGSSPYLAVIDWLKRWPSPGGRQFTLAHLFRDRFLSRSMGAFLSRSGHRNFPGAARERQSLEHLLSECHTSRPCIRTGQSRPE